MNLPPCRSWPALLLGAGLHSFPLLLGGCIMETEACGTGFVERNGRCVAPPDPPVRRREESGDFDYGTFAYDGSYWADAKEPPDRRSPDAAVPDIFIANPWSEFPYVRLVDLTSRAGARLTTDTPGADIDAVMVQGPDGRLFGQRVVSAVINDPFGRSVAQDPDSALGPPDWTEGHWSGFVSLGTEGAYLVIELELNRSLRSGDHLTVFEVENRSSSDDRVEVALCREDWSAPDACVYLGEGQSRMDFLLD